MDITGLTVRERIIWQEQKLAAKKLLQSHINALSETHALVDEAALSRAAPGACVLLAWLAALVVALLLAAQRLGRVAR